jgi:F-type H+-transporting ATPase subunit b
MRLDFWTLALQAANFLVLLWLLQRFLYRPVLRVIAARQAAADKLTAELKAEKSAAQSMRGELEHEKQATAAAREQVLTAARAEAEAERKTLLENAKRTADDLAAQSRAGLERERAELVKTIGGDAARLATAIVRRLLRDSGGEALQRRMLELVVEDLRAMPAEAKQRIRERLAAPASPVEVVTASPLSASAARSFTSQLAELVGAPVTPSFRVDQGLLAGVEVHFLFTVLRRTWSDELQRIEAELKHDDAAQTLA